MTPSRPGQQHPHRTRRTGCDPPDPGHFAPGSRRTVPFPSVAGAAAGPVAPLGEDPNNILAAAAGWATTVPTPGARYSLRPSYVVGLALGGARLADFVGPELRGCAAPGVHRQPSKLRHIVAVVP